MVFSSFVFLFGFLAPHLLVYALVPDRLKNAVLLVSSLIFYAFGGPAYLILLITETLVCYLAALLIDRTDDEARRRLLLAVAVATLLALLAYFKYAGFLLSIGHDLLGIPQAIPEVALPIGISFYTFQLISYVTDVFRACVPAQPSYLKLLLYSSLFHQCVAGPIVRYETVERDISKRRVRRQDVYAGVRRFCCGLAKKTLLANGCAACADALLPHAAEVLAAQAVTGHWLGMLFYTLEIYLDFSAYSDMAIGLGRMVGFHYRENFDYPYLASSVRDFWHRWHLSLSTFFRDYVYIPLGGSRAGSLAYLRNMLVVWFLTGLWHGASWNYVLWGLYFCVLLLAERFLVQDRIPAPANHLLTLLAVLIGWVLFRFEDFQELSLVLRGLAGDTGGGITNLSVRTVFLGNVFLLAMSLIACTDLGRRLRHALRDAGTRSELAFAVYGASEALTPVLLLALSVCAMAGASYNPFIYFQF